MHVHNEQLVGNLRELFAVIQEGGEKQLSPNQKRSTHQAPSQVVILAENVFGMIRTENLFGLVELGANP